MPDTRPASCHVHIRGNRRLANELLHRFLAQQTDPPLTCSLDNTSSELFIAEKTERPALVLLDCHTLDEEQSLLEKVREEIAALPAYCHLACINVNPAQGIEKKAVALGVRGLFYDHDSLDTVRKGVAAILNNELWFSRDTLSTSLSTYVQGGSVRTAQHLLAAGLTRREKEILSLTADGLSNDAIAKRLCISPLTVKTHLRNIYLKIDVPSRIQAIFWGNEHRLLLSG